MPVALLSARYGCGLEFSFTAGTDFRPNSGSFADESVVNIPIGTGTGQVCKDYAVEVTIASGTPATIDFTALLDENFSALSFGTIEAIKISNKSVNAGEDVTVGGGTNGLFTALPFALKALARGDSTIEIATPITVDSTHKILQLTAATGAAVKVRITFVGR